MTESLAKISSMLESAKDLTIEAAVSASSRLTDTPKDLRPKEISNLLNSRLDRDIFKGMKCVNSLISRGEDGVQYFADVVKNVTSSNVKIKNLVMIYLTKYAEVQPDTALLSINSIQKTLGEKSAINRATAIRTLGGIRIPEISSLLLLCIKRTMSDSSPWVRGSTAIAIAKAYEIPNINKKQLFENLSKLMLDSDVYVVGSSIKAFYKIKEELSTNKKKWSLIHGNFRRFTSIIHQLDEWSQCYLIEILIEYSRNFLPRPKLYLKDGLNLIIDLPDDISQISFPVYDVSMDDDLALFINSFKLLIYTRSAFVMLSITKALYALTPPLYFKDYGLNTILCKLASSDNVQISLFAYQTIKMISKHDKSIFASYFKNFYLYPTDSDAKSNIKLEVLSLLVTETNVKQIFRELKYYSLNSSHRPAIAKESIKAIGRCSQISPEWNEKILKWCSKQIKQSDGLILNELLTVIRFLIQQKQNFTGDEEKNRQDKQDIISTTLRLSLILLDDSIQIENEAKASIIWMIGEFSSISDNLIGPDILRILIKNFANESENVRYEILILAAKIYSIELTTFKNEHHDDDEESFQEFTRDNRIAKMFQQVLYLAKYDQSYDTRDRARMFHVLLNTSKSQSELASLFLLVPKPAPIVSYNETNSETSNSNFDTLNSELLKYFRVDDWTKDPTSSEIRKEIPVQKKNLSTSINNVTSISSFGNTSSRSVSPPPLNNHAISSATYQHQKVTQPKETYRLQSLDEFFGGSETEESEEEGEEDEDEEDEEDEEEDVSDTDRSSALEDSEENGEGESDEESEDESDEETSETQGLFSQGSLKTT